MSRSASGQRNAGYVETSSWSASSTSSRTAQSDSSLRSSYTGNGNSRPGLSVGGALQYRKRGRTGSDGKVDDLYRQNNRRGEIEVACSRRRLRTTLDVDGVGAERS